MCIWGVITQHDVRLGQLAEGFSIFLLALLCLALSPSVCSHTLQGCPGSNVEMLKGTMSHRNGDANRI